MKYLVNWIPLRFYVRSRNTQPDLMCDMTPYLTWVVLNGCEAQLCVT